MPRRAVPARLRSKACTKNFAEASGSGTIRAMWRILAMGHLFVLLWRHSCQCLQSRASGGGGAGFRRRRLVFGSGAARLRSIAARELEAIGSGGRHDVCDRLAGALEDAKMARAVVDDRRQFPAPARPCASSCAFNMSAPAPLRLTIEYSHCMVHLRELPQPLPLKKNTCDENWFPGGDGAYKVEGWANQTRCSHIAIGHGGARVCPRRADSRVVRH